MFFDYPIVLPADRKSFGCKRNFILFGLSVLRNQDAINCLEAYAYRIIKYIGSYIAAMGGVDVITFTAGLGENAIPLRETICKAFEFMGLEFDSEANNCRGVEKIITKEGSKITACVIPTNEEIAICEETVELVKGK